MLKARIITLMVKRFCGLGTTVKKVRQLLYQEYNVEHTLEEIEDELICIRYDNNDAVIELEEDYFPGY